MDLEAKREGGAYVGGNAPTAVVARVLGLIDGVELGIERQAYRRVLDAGGLRQGRAAASRVAALEEAECGQGDLVLGRRRVDGGQCCIVSLARVGGEVADDLRRDGVLAGRVAEGFGIVGGVVVRVQGLRVGGSKDRVG